ncbi:hypothetical protein [Sphaerisporangium corydalis]|uniref:Uncharacterized protein n=1 Tax=Sphaerisporangium corydalis TaxID=1441875 RepID=A0ABV9EAG1_9ACTN|nr:hypothetical protein [Sphaerisporangium corydalis]
MSDDSNQGTGHRRAARGRPAPAAIRRLCVAVDVQSYSVRDNRGQLAVQERLKRVLDRALSRAGLSPAAVLRQDRGDGQLILLPAGVDEARVIAVLLYEIATGLADTNPPPSPEPGTGNREKNGTGIRVEDGSGLGGMTGAEAGSRIRLRLALAQGIVHEAATGYVGKAVVDACRLVDARVVRAALTEHDERDLVVAVTDDLFQDVVVHGYAGLAAAGFRRVDVELADKNFSAAVWLAVPPVPSPPDAGGPARGRLGAFAGVPVLVAVLALAAWQMTGSGVLGPGPMPASRDASAHADPTPSESGEASRDASAHADLTPSESGDSTSSERPGSVSRGPEEIEAPFVIFDRTGSVPTCGPISGSGWVPPGYALRVYSKGGHRYFPAWNAARVDRASATWEMPELYLGPVEGPGKSVTVYAVLLPLKESAKLSREFERKWSFSSLPPRVVATHTFTVTSGPCPGSVP